MGASARKPPKFFNADSGKFRRSGAELPIPSDDPLEKHLKCKVLEWALDGYYMDVFALAKLDVEVTTTGSQAKKKDKAKTVRDRSFIN